VAFAERRGIEESVLGLKAGSLCMLVDLGSHDEASALAAELLPRLEAADDVWDMVFVRSEQVRVLTRRGEHAEAARLAELAVQQARETGDLQSIAQVLPAAATVRLGIGDPSGTVALLSELETTPNIRDELSYVRALPDGVRAALAAGASDLAARLTEGVEHRYPLHEHALATARALLLEHHGSHAEAAELFANAADRWKGFEMPWERAQTLLGQARCLLALGRPSEASQPLRQAREIFAGLGAKPALVEADALLERATALTS
jgi:tetratricopeptide (TPR) repeat protein